MPWGAARASTPSTAVTRIGSFMASPAGGGVVLSKQCWGVEVFGAIFLTAQETTPVAVD